MKKQIIILTVMLLSSMSLPTLWAGTYSGGNGSSESPYRIATAADLNDIGMNIEDFNRCFVVTQDINLADYTATQFNIIGNDSNAFTGVFDGNNHTISNFNYQSSETNFIGLFGYIDDPNAIIKNLTMLNPGINAGTGTSAAALAGSILYGTVTGCRVIGGTVSAGDNTGGLIGYSYNGIVSNCSVQTDVSGNNNVGGIVGLNSGPVSTSYSSASVTGEASVAGLIGYSSWAAIENCYSTAHVTAAGNFAGGLIGYAGYNSSLVNCYSAAPISPGGIAGGLVGYDYMTTGYLNCFWNSDLNPGLDGIANKTDPNVTAITTAEMQTAETFVSAGWQFGRIWHIGRNQTYPLLKNYLPGDLNHDNSVSLPDVAILARHWLEAL